MVANESALQGMKEITQFLGRSEATVLKLKSQYPDMPITKVEGRWESDREILADWRRTTLLGGQGPTKKGKAKFPQNPVRRGDR